MCIYRYILNNIYDTLYCIVLYCIVLCCFKAYSHGSTHFQPQLHSRVITAFIHCNDLPAHRGLIVIVTPKGP